MPQTNIVVEGFLVDALWPRLRLIVEVDSDLHREPDRFLADRRRDRVLTLAGYTVLRILREDLDAGFVEQVLRAGCAQAA